MILYMKFIMVKKYLNSFRDDPKKLIKKFNKIINTYMKNYIENR